MPLIYLRHPRHGVKIASLDMEADYDEQHGWERYTPGEEPVNELRKRSRPRKEPEHADHGG
jgi:hypothetical protein